MLNKTDLAAPLGVSVPTITEWLGILEITGQIILVPPYFENFGKRLVKSPKLYWVDAGLACHLLGIESEHALNQSPFLGPLFEGFVASEILKLQLGAGRARELYYFRDQQGLEVDFVVPVGHRRLALLEARASRTAVPEMASPLERLGQAMTGYELRNWLIHRPRPETHPLRVLRPGIRAGSVENLREILARDG